ncbi:MAG: hypothetical protein JO210_11195, partial [Acidobacteriaceae bacterium]|nr:hypothetical protein [Acidobacteriaceae bacterium]
FALSFLPKRYTSEATLVVVQQQVPERYVTPTSTTDIGAALEATTQEVLSRTGLLDIITEFDLYPKDRARLSPEELEAKMRKKISIVPIITRPDQKSIDAFKISFAAENPRKAQAVTNRLTSLFIEQNLETREHQATVTTGFLKEQLEVARVKLAQQEARVRDFKLQNLGQLPEQQGGNLAVLTGLQAQLQNIQSSEARAQEQQVYLQSLLNGYRSLPDRGAAIMGQAGASQSSNPLEVAKADLARLKAKKAALLSVYTPEFPDVIKVNGEIAQAEASLKALIAAKADTERDDTTQSSSGARPAEVSSGNAQVDTSVAQVKSQLDANRVELENLARDEKQAKADIAQYQERLNLTPVREQQLAGLLRDYDLLKQDYTDLLSKETQSQLAGSLEKRQAGQQFRLIDPPSLPVVPSFPKRLPIGLGGAVAGLVLGAALAFLADIRKGSFYSEKDLSRHFSIPLVISIPVLRTPSEERARNLQTAFEWIAATAVVGTVFAAEFFELYLRRNG